MSSQEMILAIDVGTSSCKSVLYRETGAIVASATSPYDSHHPRPGWVEQAPADWWKAVISTARECAAFSQTGGRPLAAIVVTGQMHGLLPLGSDGLSLCPCLTLHDQRAVCEADQIIADLGLGTVHSITGARLTASSPLAKILWLKRHDPSSYAKASYFLGCKDYIKYLLTGQINSDPIEAAGTLLFDIGCQHWSDDLMSVIGLARDRLPAVCAPWDLGGSLSREAATLLNLTPGTPVLVGAGDDIEFLGMGLIRPGSSLEHFGSTGSILTCVDRPVWDPSVAVDLYPHAHSNAWLLGGSVNNAGAALAWASRVLYGNGSDHLSEILGRQLGPHLSQPLLFLPHLSGERCPVWNPRLRAGWLGLGIEHTRDDMLRAVAEGVLFSLKHIIERIEELSVPVTSIAVSNTNAASQPWLRLCASIYGRKLQLLDVTEPTALGCMIVAAKGIGVFDSLQQGVAKVVRVKEEIDPDPEMVDSYASLHALFREAVDRCSPLFDGMKAVSGRSHAAD